MLTQRVIIVPAFAKINLTLEILRRRSDSYHELASVFQSIALHDSIAIHPTTDGMRTLVCDLPELENDHNLALRAANALVDVTGGSLATSIRIELHKKVPTQAGLGGGSSDAASVVLALSARREPPLIASQTLAIASDLGSDVPYFLCGGTALVRGRGELVDPLPDVDDLWIVLVKPSIAVSTPAAFRALAEADFSDGTRTMALVEAIHRTRRLPLADLTNGFEASVFREYPEVARIRRALLDAGAPVVRLSGSGPTLFAPFESLKPAQQVYANIANLGLECWLTHTISRNEFVRTHNTIQSDASDVH